MTALTTLFPTLDDSRTVTEFDGQIAELAETLFEIMTTAGGVALSACTIGRPERVMVVDLPDAAGDVWTLALVNPRITAVHDGVADQNALFPTLPSMARFQRIEVMHETLEGETVILTADGPLAIGLQVQIDLLNGESRPRRLH